MLWYLAEEELESGEEKDGGGGSTIAQREDVVRRTVYVSEIDHSVI